MSDEEKPVDPAGAAPSADLPPDGLDLARALTRASARTTPAKRAKKRCLLYTSPSPRD